MLQNTSWIFLSQVGYFVGVKELSIKELMFDTFREKKIWKTYVQTFRNDFLQARCIMSWQNFSLLSVFEWATLRDKYLKCGFRLHNRNDNCKLFQKLRQSIFFNPPDTIVQKQLFRWVLGKEMLWKYAANLQESSHVEAWFQ